MTRVAVTFVSAAGVVAAILISIRHGARALTRPSRPDDEPVGGGPGALRAFRATTVAILSGALTTALVAGLGGRLVMRIAAFTSDESVQGRITEAEEVVGEITIGGTVGLVLFLTLFAGAAIGVFYCVLRPFLPGPAWLAGLAPTMIVAATMGRASGFIDPDNVDFSILEPRPLIAAMCLGLIVLFGTTLGASYEWLNAKVPLLRRRGRAIAWYVPLVPLSLMPISAIFVGLGGIAGAVTPSRARDLIRNRRFNRGVGTLIAFAATLATVSVVSATATIAT